MPNPHQWHHHRRIKTNPAQCPQRRRKIIQIKTPRIISQQRTMMKRQSNNRLIRITTKIRPTIRQSIPKLLTTKSRSSIQPRSSIQQSRRSRRNRRNIPTTNRTTPSSRTTRIYTTSLAIKQRRQHRRCPPPSTRSGSAPTRLLRRSRHTPSSQQHNSRCARPPNSPDTITAQHKLLLALSIRSTTLTNYNIQIYRLNTPTLQTAPQPEALKTLIMDTPSAAVSASSPPALGCQQASRLSGSRTHRQQTCSQTGTHANSNERRSPCSSPREL